MTTEQEVTIKTTDLLTVTRAAEFLGIHRQTLWRWVRVGKIRPIEFDNHRFFHISELQALKQGKIRKLLNEKGHLEVK